MIREVYQGDLRPCDNMKMSDEYKRKSQALYELSDAFQKHLKLDDLECFENLMDQHLELISIAIEDGYMAGFKDGVRLIMEIMSGV